MLNDSQNVSLKCLLVFLYRPNVQTEVRCIKYELIAIFMPIHVVVLEEQCDIYLADVWTDRQMDGTKANT